MPAAKLTPIAELKRVVVIRGTGERIDLGRPGEPGSLTRKIHEFRAWRYRRRCAGEGRSV